MQDVTGNLTYIFEGNLKKESNIVSFETNGRANFDNSSKNFMSRGNVGDIQLRVTSTLDKKLKIAKEIKEDWNMCDREIRLIWKLKNINYLGEEYALYN